VKTRVVCAVSMCAAMAVSAAWSAAPPVVVRPGGVGTLQLGQTLAAVRKRGVVGATSLGCELVRPRPLVARLKGAVKGWATFSGGAPHRLTAVSITSGARTARGVRVGDSARRVVARYPGAHKQYAAPGDPLQLSALVVRTGSKSMWFVLDHAGGHVRSIDIPVPQTCE
jgi:hypothetical protein